MFSHTQRKHDVLQYRHMRVEGIILEDHPDVAILGMQSDDGLAVDGDIAGSGIQKTRDDVQRSAFAAAAGTKQADQFSVLNIKADILQGLISVLIHLPEILD